VVQTITSSVDFVTGSTRFGTLLSNTHVFSGSVTMNPNGLFVSSSGNVGIGTTNPTATLHVSGTTGGVFEVDGAGVINALFVSASGRIGIGNTTPTETLFLQDPNRNPTIGITHAGGGSYFMKFQQFSGWNQLMTFTSAASYMGINTSGPLILNESGSNVGIGLTNPSYPFHISAFDGSFALTGTRGTGTTHLWYTSGANNQNLIFNNPSGDSYFYSNSTPVLSITTNKYVGIGINGPTNLLHVEKSLPSEAIVNFNNTSSTGFGLNINAGGGTRYVLSLNDYNGSALARFLANGNVYIGNTTGDGRLHVKTASAVAYNASGYNGSNANIRLESGATVTTGTTTGISFGVGGSAEAYIGAVQNSSNLAEIVFQNYDGAYRERMRITSGGEVQISNSILRLNAISTTSVSTSATTISTGSNTYGGLAIVWGADSSGNIFTDLLFYSLGQVFVIRGQDVSGGPFGRTYTVNGSGALRLTMGGGPYSVRYQAVLTS
jgi:hypothetical protein